MADRERCIFCTRERATEEDWCHPAMENDDPHAELDALCWDLEGEDGCAAHMLEIGRPANLEDALPYVDRLDTLLAGLKAEVERFRQEARVAVKSRENSKAREDFSVAARMDVQARARTVAAERLEHLIKQAGGEQ